MSDITISAGMDAGLLYREFNKIDQELVQRQQAEAARAAAGREQGLAEARASALRTVEWAEGVSRRQAEQQSQRFEAMARSARQLMTVLPGAWMAAERAIAAYAEKNSVVKAQLEATRGEGRGIIEDVGRDIAGALPAVQTVLSGVRQVRDLVVDYQAFLYRGMLGPHGLAGDGSSREFENLNRTIEQQDVRAKSLAQMDELRKRDRIAPEDPVERARQERDDAIRQRQRELDKLQGLSADEKAANIAGLRAFHEEKIGKLIEQQRLTREQENAAADDERMKRALEQDEQSREASRRAEETYRQRKALEETLRLEAARPDMTAEELEQTQRLVALRERLQTIRDSEYGQSQQAELASLAQAAFDSAERARQAARPMQTVQVAGTFGATTTAQALGASANWAQQQVRATNEGTEAINRLRGEVESLKRELGLGGIGNLRI